MKQKFLKGFIATAIVVLLVGYGMSRSANNSNTELSDLTLANIEALAQSEFEYAGETWDTDHHWYNHFGYYFYPKIVECTITRSFGKESTFISESFNGKMVECGYGDGNCWNGTMCLP